MVRGLEQPLADKVKLEVLPVTDASIAGKNEEIFPNSKHGMIAWGADGEIIDKIEGHTFGKDEIMALVQRLTD